MGEISDPVRTEFGFHIIRVTDRRVAPFEDVRDQIETQLATGAEDKAWNEFVRTAYEEAGVKVNPRYGEFDDDELRVVDATSDQLPGTVRPTATPEATPTQGG